MRISVFGIGYVGAVSSACLARLGHQVIGVDANPLKVDLVNQGRSPIVETSIDDMIAEAVAQGRLTATTDGAQAVAATDLSLICVGTPSAPDGSTSFDAVDAVIAEIGAVIASKPSHAVVMRSTLPPGTAEERVIPALENAAKRRIGNALSYYANPEFLREGTAVRDFGTPPFTLIGATPDDEAA